VLKATLIFYARLRERHHPPTKYALAKNSKGRRTALEKPKLPIIAIIGSFPRYV